jgi:hypothetical protein
MSSRTHRKALPLDHTGIHWGNGSRHESGTPWEYDEWKQFVAWACENGAKSDYDGGRCIVEWCTPCEGPGGHAQFHREDGPARIYPSGMQEWWLNGHRQ